MFTQEFDLRTAMNGRKYALRTSIPSVTANLSRCAHSPTGKKHCVGLKSKIPISETSSIRSRVESMRLGIDQHDCGPHQLKVSLPSMPAVACDPLISRTSWRERVGGSRAPIPCIAAEALRQGFLCATASLTLLARRNFAHFHAH